MSTDWLPKNPSKGREGDVQMRETDEQRLAETDSKDSASEIIGGRERQCIRLRSPDNEQEALSIPTLPPSLPLF
jgi:hypothetical protein